MKLFEITVAGRRFAVAREAGGGDQFYRRTTTRLPGSARSARISLAIRRCPQTSDP
jgi:hypothetical protein